MPNVQPDAPLDRRLHPFDIVCLPLNYSGNPGVNDVSYRGYTHHPHPFDTGCLPLSYSGNPGAHTGDIRRVIRSAGNQVKNTQVVGTIQYIEWLILNDRVQPSFIAGVEGLCVEASPYI